MVSYLRAMIDHAHQYRTTRTVKPSAMADPAVHAGFNSCAYVTLLCDETSLLPTATMIGSLVETNTPAHIVPLVTADVSTAARTTLERLASNVKTRQIELIVHPYMHRRAKRSSQALDNKSCRYTKLHAWSVIEYERVILLDADTIILQSMDGLFLLPFPRAEVIYAVADVYPRVFNSGLIVLRPSLSLHRTLCDKATKLASYNHGDQGFLNEFFSSHSFTRSSTMRVLFENNPPGHVDVGLAWVPIDAAYNFPIWLAKSYYGKSKYPHFPDGATMVHFAGEVKPWQFESTTQASWSRFYEPRAFFRWWTRADDMVELMCDSVDLMRPCRNLSRRAVHVCDVNADVFAAERFKRATDSLTVVISTFSGDRLPLEVLVQHYANSSSVSRVVVIWHDPSIQQSSDLPARRFVNGVVVTNLQQSTDSLNNRFVPFDVDTAVVLICDDDIVVSLDDLSFAFSVAREHPDRLLSPFVRASQRFDTNQQHQGSNVNISWGSLGYFEHDMSFTSSGSRQYSMALTKLCFAPAWLLFLYSCALDRRVYTYVDKKHNCEDVAFNLVAAAAGLRAPMMLDIVVRDFGIQDGLSSRRNHVVDRRDCVPDLMELVAPRIPKNTFLRRGSSAVSRFISTRVKYSRLSSEVKTSQLLDETPRLILQHDTAVAVHPIEDCSIDSSLRHGQGAYQVAAGPWLYVRSSPSGQTSRTSGLHSLSEPADVLLEAPVSQLEDTGPRFSSGSHLSMLNLQQRTKQRAEAIILLKLRRIDLDRVDNKDEHRGSLILELVTESQTMVLSDCPMRAFYLPKFPEDWTPHGISYSFVVDLVDVLSSTGFYTPLVSVASLILFNLRAIDAAYQRSGRTNSGNTPINITIALFIDDTATSRNACNFSSSRGSVRVVCRLHSNS
mmetsp:Transcript_24704/g.98002  ORF Transcript_24704/g.98002 Transcript_24704/m.98002 type:complete len:896 (-) Transcript_24704:1342-4029(-)